MTNFPENFLLWTSKAFSKFCFITRVFLYTQILKAKRGKLTTRMNGEICWFHSHCVIFTSVVLRETERNSEINKNLICLEMFLRLEVKRDYLIFKWVCNFGASLVSFSSLSCKWKRLLPLCLQIFKECDWAEDEHFISRKKTFTRNSGA